MLLTLGHSLISRNQMTAKDLLAKVIAAPKHLLSSLFY